MTDRDAMLKESAERIMENGMAHLVYYQNGVEGMINPYSADGYETLSDDFKAFLEKYRIVVPKKVPIVLEIVGKPLKEEEKKLIDNAIWAHFALCMSEADRKAKKVLKTSIIYIFFTVLSAFLLFAAKSETREVVTNFAYMPFWFFGYRVLIYILIDSRPIWRDRTWYRRLASMKLLFSGEESRSLFCLDYNSVCREIGRYEQETENEVRENRMVMEYLMDQGIVAIECRVGSVRDIIQIPELKGREFLSEGLSGYLRQTEPFISRNDPISLKIIGSCFTEDEKQAIDRAVRNYYRFRIASQERESGINRRMILSFGLFVVISALILMLWGKTADVAVHEFITMLFWFFGDYLLEFVLITHADIRKTGKILENCRKMKISYSETQVPEAEHPGKTDGQKENPEDQI